MLTGALKTLKELDALLSENYPAVKLNSNGSAAYAKVYLLHDGRKIRIFFDERDGRGTVKFKGRKNANTAVQTSQSNRRREGSNI